MKVELYDVVQCGNHAYYDKARLYRLNGRVFARSRFNWAPCKPAEGDAISSTAVALAANTLPAFPTFPYATKGLRVRPARILTTPTAGGPELVGNVHFRPIKWRSWTARSAVGAGVVITDSGRPDLARSGSVPDQEKLQELIATNSQGILAAVTQAGYPHLTNVLYVWDATERRARVSTTALRVKGRILRRDRRAALHVAGAHFWSYAVAECDAEVSNVATTPGDATCRELLEVHSAFYGKIADETAFFAQMIEAQRLVIRLRVKRLYGVLLDNPPGA